MKYCASKDIDRLVKCLIRNGWLFRRGGKHGRANLSVPSTPSDHRAFLNFRRDVRQVLAA